MYFAVNYGWELITNTFITADENIAFE